MLSPVVSHVPCDLDLQRRIREARRESTLRAVLRRRRGRGGPAEPSAVDLRPAGEDVWHSLRF